MICVNLPKDHYVQVLWKCITDHFSKTLAKRSITLNDLRWPLTPHMLMSHVRLYPRITVSNSHVDTVTIFQKLNQKVNGPKMTFDPHFCWGHMWLYLRVIVSKSHENTLKYVDTVTLFSKTWIKGHWPLYDFDPTSVEVTCVTLPKDHCVQVPWGYIHACGCSDQFCKTYHILTTYTKYAHTWVIT